MIQVVDQEPREKVAPAEPRKVTLPEPKRPRLHLIGKPPEGWVEDFYTQHGTAD